MLAHNNIAGTCNVCICTDLSCTHRWLNRTTSSSVAQDMRTTHWFSYNWTAARSIYENHIDNMQAVSAMIVYGLCLKFVVMDLVCVKYWWWSRLAGALFMVRDVRCNTTWTGIELKVNGERVGYLLVCSFDGWWLRVHGWRYANV